MGEDLADLLPRQHLRHEEHGVAAGVQLGDGGVGLGGELGRVGGAGDEHDLGARVEVEPGPQEVWHALLAGDAPDEHDRRPRQVDAEAVEHVGLLDRPEELGIDAVVDDVDTLGVERRVAAPGRPARDAALTAMIASADSYAVRSAHDDRR